MRIQITYLVLFLFLASCQKEKQLTFKELNLDETRCSECPDVSIHIPNALENSKAATTINTAIKEEIIAILNYDDEVEAATIKQAVKSFSNGYWELKKKYPKDAHAWVAKIEGQITYEDPALLTIELNYYLSTGGAHGISSKRFLNFDKERGKELENWQLFQNRDDFQSYVERKFRNQEAIPLEGPINSTGLMFEKDSFYLPENIGFTQEGVKLRYNPYEVASYADGPIEITLPFQDIKPFLATKRKS